MVQQTFGDYERGEGAVFKGPLIAAGARAQERIATRQGWTRAKAVRRAVRAYLRYLAAHPDVVIEAPGDAGPPFPGRYDTGIEANTIADVEAVAKRFGVRRNIVVAAALTWYVESWDEPNL